MNATFCTSSVCRRLEAVAAAGHAHLPAALQGLPRCGDIQRSGGIYLQQGAVGGCFRLKTTEQ